MDVSAITSGLFGRSSSAGQSAAANMDPIAAALKKADSRIEQQLSSTNVQLSAYGQIKGALSDLQGAAKSLSDAKQTATTDDVKKAVANFVAAHNKANQTIGAATQNNGKQTGALADDARAGLAANDLRRSVADGNGLANLKNIGITQNKDGSLSVDSKTLDAALKANPDAVRSTLANVGGQVDKMATRELAGNGNVGASVNTLSNQSRNLEAQRNTQQEQAAAAQQQINQQSARLNSVIANGIAAYQRTLTA